MKRFFFKSKYIIIVVSAIVIVLGSYYAVTEFIKRSNTPSIERDSSLEFRNDLNLSELIPYRKGDKWGYCDKNKKIIIEPIYSSVNFFDEQSGTAIVNYNGLYGLINKKGEKLLTYNYDSLKYIESPSSSTDFKLYAKRLVAKKGEEFGVIDIEGNEIIPFKYLNLLPIGKVFIASIVSGNRSTYGLLDLSGKNITEFIYSEISSTKNKSLFVAEKFTIGVNYPKELYDLLKKSRFLYDKPYIKSYENFLNYLRNDIEGAKKLYLLLYGKSTVFNTDFYDSKIVGCINDKGKIIIPFEYSFIDDYNYTNYLVAKKFTPFNERGIWGIFNYSGELVIPIIYDDFLSRNHFFYYGFSSYAEAQNIGVPFICVKNEQFGSVDINNKIVISFNYSFLFTLDGKYFFGYKDDDKVRGTNVINEFGEIIIPQTMQPRPNNFNPSMPLIVSKDNKYGLCNYDNGMVTDFVYDSLYPNIFGYTNFEFRDNKQSYKCGVINEVGKQIITSQYDSIGNVEYEPFSMEERFDDPNFLIVKFNSKWGLIGSKLKLILPIRYDEISKFRTFDLFKVKLNNKIGYVDLNGVEYFEE